MLLPSKAAVPKKSVSKNPRASTRAGTAKPKSARGGGAGARAGASTSRGASSSRGTSSSRSPGSSRGGSASRTGSGKNRFGSFAKSDASRTGKPRFKKSSTKTTPSDPSAQRLNKVLAAAGLGSRREVEELIVQGRVEVDKEVVTDLARRVDPSAVTIKVDGQALKKFKPVYFALNKPKGVLSTNKDPSGRVRVIDLVPDNQRVFSVGRLDRNSEGLTLLTNDGELAQRLAHPKFGVQKAYFVVVAGVMTKEELAKLRKGVYLAEGVARIDGATIRKHRKGCTELEIVLSEGKNREIRRILARAGHKVVVLRRIAIGSLRLGQLPVGASRQLTSSEVKALYAATQPGVGKKSGTDKSATKKAVGKGRGQAMSTDGMNPKSKSTKTRKPAPDEADGWLEDDESEEFSMPEFFGEGAITEFGDAMDSEFESDFDDDFVGDFSGLNSEGSVLGFEDESPVEARPRSGKRQAGERKQAGRARSSTKSAGRVSAKKSSASGRGKPKAKNAPRGSGGKSKRR